MSSHKAALWHTVVRTNYRAFGLFDPTCEERENFSRALSDSTSAIVGWAKNAFIVQVASDLVGIRVQVEVLLENPAIDASGGLLRDGTLELPGGMISIPESVDGQFRLGVALPSGPGTYGVRVLGYGRERAREMWAQMSDATTADDVLGGIEHYRVYLWQMSPEPQWADDDDDE